MGSLQLWNDLKEQGRYSFPFELYPWRSLEDFLEKDPLFITSSYRVKAYKTFEATRQSQAFLGDGVYQTDQQELISCFSGWLGIFEFNENDYYSQLINNRKYCPCHVLNCSMYSFDIHMNYHNGQFTFYSSENNFKRTINT